MIATFSESLPDEWTEQRLKYAAPLRIERVEATSEHTSYLGLENIQSWTGKLLPAENGDSGAEGESEGGTVNSFRHDDVLFGKLRPYLAKAFHANRDGVCSTELLVLKPRPDMHPRFLLYSFLSPEFVGLVDASTFGAKMPRANWDFIGSMKIPVPNLDAQKRIADYLDRETAHIDPLIAEKQRMLALLEEKRAALISRAVTRGLTNSLGANLNAGACDGGPKGEGRDSPSNPDVPLKPSGLDWLGDIPAHWDMKRAKGLFREIDRRSVTGEEELLSLRMNVGLVPHNDVSDKELEPKDLVGFKHVEPGQMVINRMRAASGLIAISSRTGLVSPDYAVFEIIESKVNIDYFLALFTTGLVQAVFRSSSKGLGTGSSGFLRLYTENFLALHFPFPNQEEQQNIVDFLRSESEQMSEVEAVLKDSIGLLKERRSALITAAVTGQIDPKERAA
ncbi:MAG: restriction endonuclease subunit S [Candidatus Thiodiazotropha sp. (ex Dulcina madagascariensis)]|nr:restriction endonuclease subunit S [Candidatus Thiodiazotropha sp. (ex Dulcina madagascariensis)]